MPSITLKDAGIYFSRTGPLATALRAAATKGLFSAALRAKRDIVAREINKGAQGRRPVDRGVYRAGWQVERLPTGAAIYNSVPHASFIEYGVPAANVVPSRKAVLAIAEWAQRKLGGRTKQVSVAQMRETSKSVNAAKAKYDKAKSTWTTRAKSAREKNKPEPPRPRPPAILTGKKRLKTDYNYAFGVAYAILGAMKKRGIFNNGRGLRIMENYAKHSLPVVIRDEVEREIAKVAR